MQTQPSVIVAGSSRGIGLACVSRFLDAGWRVAGIARTPQMSSANGLLHVSADLTRDDDAERAVNDIFKAFGRIDAVVHCVGDIEATEQICGMSWSRWMRAYDVCVGTFVRLVKASYSHIVDAKGAYVAISSVAAMRPYPGIADYCAAKAALSSVVRSVAAELAPAGGRANSISPAVVDTELFRRGPYQPHEAAQWHKLGRIGRPSEVAALAVFLASSTGEWITGCDYTIDGGMLL